MKEVAKLKSLLSLKLTSTKITDAGLKEITQLKKLKVIYLRRTKVTENGIEQLKKALPELDDY